jgi:uncharacterized membrane protein
MKSFMINWCWVERYAVELVLGFLIILLIGVTVVAVQQDQQYNTKCEAAGGMLITTDDSQYMCIRKDATIKL